MKEKNKLFTDFLADTTNPIVLITLTLGNKSFLEKASFSVEITQKTNDHDEFLIIVPDIAVDAFSGYILENSKHLLGENLIINFHRYGVVNQSFTGVITRILNKKNQGGGYGELHILGKSLSILLENGKNCQSFENQSLSEIVESVSQGKITPVGGLNFESKIPYVVQWQESDYEFFSRLAKRYGEFFYYNENELIFGNKTQNTVILEEGGELLEVSFELFVKPQKFNYLSYDLGKGGRIEKEDSSISVQEKNNSILQVAKNISERIFTKKSETYASQIVDYQEDYFLSELVKKEKESREQLLKVRGKSLNPLLKNGGFIKLKDINGKPMETYRIIEIKHYQSGYEYFNEFIAIPDVFVPYYFDADAFPKSEAQIAKVLDNNDPEGLGRVRVQFLWQEKNQQKTPWIRVLQPHAGAGKGFYFVPEIGEEVWVDFENQNAERPYVVGSQYNGKQKSLYHTTGNDKKVIHTRSGTKIILNDAQGSVFIEDSSGNSIHLDGKRKISFNGATLEFNAQKIIMNATESTQITTNDYILNALSKIYVFSNWFKQQINGFVQMFSTKTLIKGAEIVDIEAKEAKLHGTEKMIAHSDKLALVNSKETLEVKGQKKNNFSNKAESINSNPNQKITNVMVEFRPHDGWQGEFGFDWLRIDDGAETTEAKYYDCLEDLASGYEKPTQGDSNTIFENKNEAFLALEKEYEHLVIQRNNNSVLTKYYIPWLNLYPENITNSFQYEPKPPCEAILKVLVDIQDEEPEQIRITFNKEYFIINGKDGTDANPVLIEDKIIGAKRDAGQITVKCIKQFTNRQEIIIYAYPQGSLSKTPAEQKLLRKIAGKIILEPNANTSSLRNRKFLNIVFVKVKTNFFDNIEANSKIGNFDSGRTVGEITMLRNILYQSLVTFKEITKDVRGQEIILNLFDNSDFKQKFDSSGNPIDSDYISMNGELRAKSVKKMRELFNSQTNNKYINDMLIFSLDERGEDFNGIVEEIGKKNAVIVNTRTKETMPHEVLHGLGLYHSHQDFSIVKVNDRTPQSSSVFIPNRLNDKECLYLASDNSLWTYNGTNYMPYTFKEDRKYIYQNGDVAPTYATDNIMSYNRGVRKSTWRWQWKILKRNTK